MKTKVRDKNVENPRDFLQDILESTLTDIIQKFFESPEVKKYDLKGFSPQDISAGALVTIFTKNLAYIAALEKKFDHERYLEGVFESMAHLFAKCHAGYVEVLKDKDEKNSSSH